MQRWRQDSDIHRAMRRCYDYHQHRLTQVAERGGQRSRDEDEHCEVTEVRGIQADLGGVLRVRTVGRDRRDAAGYLESTMLIWKRPVSKSGNYHVDDVGGGEEEDGDGGEYPPEPHGVIDPLEEVYDGGMAYL